VTNLVQLVGLGIAIDYSLLIVYRFREELARRPWAASRERELRDEAVVRTMQTAGRAVIFSGATVAIGLGLLLFMPIPFVRSIGIGGFLIPLVSVAAAATLQPALLALFGRRGTRRVPVAPWLRDRLHVPLPQLPATKDVDRGFWARLARSIMRRPLPYLVVGGSILIGCALPALGLHLTPGSAEGIPQSPQSVRGLNVLRRAVGPGALSPSFVVVDAGRGRSVRDPAVAAAIGRLAAALRSDPEIALVTFAPRPPFVDPTGRYARVIASGRSEYGDPPAQRFAHRLRDTLIPAARFPAGTEVLGGGGPPEGVDFLERSYGVFPWLVAAVLVLTYLVLLRAFRSLLLPLKAVLLNLLSVAATYGLMVVVFRYGLGADVLGLYTAPQIEGWIPIFLFAMLFGLSMDYEVFLVTRMRESWDHVHDNARAVAHGLERTGRIITAAAVIMVAAFSGLMAGSVVGLQQFGFGLAIAILLDATLVRAILVPALMAVFGRWNWWLPARVARVARVAPSPLEQPAIRVGGR
jgi:RND superfamily putative drug exporter